MGSPATTWILLALFAAPGVPQEAVESTTASEIARRLICYCGTCSNQTIHDCTCGTAAGARVEIRHRLEKGESPQEILQYFTNRFGEQILIAPTKQGFNLVAWVTPFLAILAGGILLLLVFRRWSLQGAPVSPEEGAALRSPSPADQKYLEQMEREIRKYEG